MEYARLDVIEKNVGFCFCQNSAQHITAEIQNISFVKINVAAFHIVNVKRLLTCNKYRQGTSISHRPPANIFHMRHGSAVSSYHIFLMINVIIYISETEKTQHLTYTISFQIYTIQIF